MKYFVSYRTSSGFGRCSVTRDKPILDIPDIESIEDGLRLSNGENQIAILNWREFHSISQPQENLADSSQAVQQLKDSISELKAIRNGLKMFKRIPKNQFIRDIDAVLAKLESI